MVKCAGLGMVMSSGNGRRGAMARNRLFAATICIILEMMLSGCLATVVRTEHDYILMRTENGVLAVMEDDDPRYTHFDGEVLSDPFLKRLLMTYEHATEGFLAANMDRALPQAIANKPILVTDSAHVEVLRNIEAQYEGERIRVDLALGVGTWPKSDPVTTRRSLVPAMASWLLELMGLQPSGAVHPVIYEPTTPPLAFRAGFEGALEAIYGQQHPEELAGLRLGASLAPEARERLLRYEGVPANAFRHRFAGGVPIPERHAREEALRTPGVVATFFYRLLEHNSSFYPQRYMLWFTNFDPEEIPYAKVLLTVSHLPRGKVVSLQSFLDAYIELFPAEKTSVLALADEVFGR